mmetsp:Transcript_90012/g.263121  ORF Transcript_90012/g.263121 Transcript_90012/m.263121 type:complete len:233 (-) Transcript_90012:1705-2403(-)
MTSLRSVMVTAAEGRLLMLRRAWQQNPTKTSSSNKQGPQSTRSPAASTRPHCSARARESPRASMPPPCSPTVWEPGPASRSATPAEPDGAPATAAAAAVALAALAAREAGPHKAADSRCASCMEASADASSSSSCRSSITVIHSPSSTEEMDGVSCNELKPSQISSAQSRRRGMRASLSSNVPQCVETAIRPVGAVQSFRTGGVNAMYLTDAPTVNMSSLRERRAREERALT